MTIRPDHGLPRSDPRRNLGSLGEDRAAQWYVAAGYTVLDRNWRAAPAPGRREETVGGEIDLVLAKGATLVFCEVKTRRGDRFGEPYEAVTPSKQGRIRRLAAQWLRERGPAAEIRADEIRFDVVSVRGELLSVLEGAF